MKHLVILLSCILVLFFSVSPSTCEAQESPKPWLNPSGMTVETRFNPPKGFTRKPYDDPYTDYMRKLPMLPDGSPVRIFTGDLKQNQSIHVGVLDIDVGDRDLQQCSDAAQRIRTDYLFESKQYDKISYHFVNGMEFPWNKYKQGYRSKLDGRKTKLVKSAAANSSPEAFRNYQNALFMYAGVSSVMKESPEITVAEMHPGDAIAGKGHLIIILDVVENEKGDKMVLLAQSYIPAQQIEVLSNPYSDSPWYDAKLFTTCPFMTPEWQYDCPYPKIYRLL